MRILIVRHARAGKADPREWPDDDDRPLTPVGRKAFALAARGLREAGPRPRAVLSSPAARALQTAGILSEAMGLGRKAAAALPALHHAASPRAALSALARLDLPGDFAVVGHAPHLCELASLLIAGSPSRAALSLGKGAACLIESPSLAPGAGCLAWSMTADHLTALARGCVGGRAFF
jgi:phosphohistidine phosphatase